MLPPSPQSLSDTTPQILIRFEPLLFSGVGLLFYFLSLLGQLVFLFLFHERSHAIFGRIALPVMRTRCWSSQVLGLRSAWTMTWILVLSLWLALAHGMRDNKIKELR